MKPNTSSVRPLLSMFVGCLLATSTALAHDVDQQLLDILLSNGAISQSQHDLLSEKHRQEHDSSSSHAQADDAPVRTSAAESAEDLDMVVSEAVTAAVAEQIAEQTPVKASYDSKGFRLQTRDGNFQTNLQWRAQLRYTNPFSGDPRQLSAFDSNSESTFEARRLRMKIGGHGFQPWLKYYFEVDLQPTRDVDDSSSSASARVIDWRIDVAKWDWGGLRVGQWKVDYNRERVDSSGRQQFVERSIVNRQFTVDRQIGVQLRGHANKGTAADLRWYLGAFTGEGRGVRNTDNNLMYIGRVQWNFLGRDLGLRQTDVEFTELPTASLAFGAASTTGSCTRWSSSGCGNLDGFTSPGNAAVDQFDIDQAVQEFAFKWRGFSVQQEYHKKRVTDRLAGTENDLTGGYIQSGYFFHNKIPAIPEPLELALRYAFVEEPNVLDRSLDNEREELSLAANWFFSGHNNKLTFDVSRLTLDDVVTGRDESENRVRVQWDVSF
ncbi:MAG: porin [Lysobacterales bacterium]